MSSSTSFTLAASFSPFSPGAAPFTYTSPAGTVTGVSEYQVISLVVPQGPYTVVPPLTNAINAFFLVNLDKTASVTVSFCPAGIPQDSPAYHTYTVAPGGWIGGTADLNKNSNVVITASNPAGSSCVLYLAGS